jgi:hypothetical protein
MKPESLKKIQAGCPTLNRVLSAAKDKESWECQICHNAPAKERIADKLQVCPDCAESIHFAKGLGMDYGSIAKVMASEFLGKKQFKIGDKVKGVGGYYAKCKTLQGVNVTSVSPDGKWIGFNLPDSHDDEDIASGKIPNFPAEDFELVKASTNLTAMRTKDLKIGDETRSGVLMAGGPGFKIYSVGTSLVLELGNKIHEIKEPEVDYNTILQYVNLRYQPADRQEAVKQAFMNLVSKLKSPMSDH